MAAIATTDVTIIHTWREPRQGRQNLLHRIVDIVLASNGGTAGDMPAATFGFNSFLYAYSLSHTGASADLHCVPVILEGGGTGILTINLEAATDNVRSDPANPPVDGTLRVHLVGIEAQ